MKLLVERVVAKVILFMVVGMTMPVLASDIAERFALHGREMPDDYEEIRQRACDKDESRSGSKRKLLTSANPSYPESIGGQKSYEYISSFTVTPKGGYYKITVKVICPKLYDADGYPGYGSTLEYVNVWIDWNGDYSWSDSERVMTKSSANYKKILADNKVLYFETTVKDASTAGGTFKARAMLGYGYNPSNPATYSWTWGDVMDVPVTFNSEPPQIYSFTIGAFADTGVLSAQGAQKSGVKWATANNVVLAGCENTINIYVAVRDSDRNKPGFNYNVILTTDSGMKIGEGKLAATPSAHGNIGNSDIEYGLYYVSNNGNPIKWTPEITSEASQYGEHYVIATVDCNDPGVDVCQMPQKFKCYIFYPAEQYVEPGVRMWYHMWSANDIMPELSNFIFWELGDGTRGMTDSSASYSWDPSQPKGTEMEIDWKFRYFITSEAWQIQAPVVFETFTQSQVATHIDSVYRTVKHEFKHAQVISENTTAIIDSVILPGGGEEKYVKIKGDKDGKVGVKDGKTIWISGDLLVASHEMEIGSNETLVDTYGMESKSASYASNGDQEYYVRWSTNGERAPESVRNKDWSFPGAQTPAEFSNWGVSTKSAKKGSLQAHLKLLGAEPSMTATYLSNAIDAEMTSFILEDVGLMVANDAPMVSFESFSDVSDDYSTQGLVLEAEITHNIDGECSFSAYLLGTNGIALARARTLDVFDSSKKRVQFVFSADTLAKVCEVYSGPYILGRVVCEPSSNPFSNVYSAKNVLTTKDYSAYECKVSKPIVGSALSDYSDSAGLHVVMPVTVPMAGTYAISAYLATTNGMNLVAISTNCVCKEGKNNIDLCFSKDAVFNTKVTGRFMVRDVSVAAEGAEPSLFVADYVTSEYDYSAFNPGNRSIVIQPNTIALSVSEDADDPTGLYKGVAVRFTVNNESSSDYALYRVSAILADANGYNVAYASEDLILNGSSSQTLFFSAQDIRESGKDGPYSVKQIRITDRITGELIDACAVSAARTVLLATTDFKDVMTVDEDSIAISLISAGWNLYSGIHLFVSLHSPSAGFVTLSARLDAADGSSVGLFETEVEVTAGDNKLVLTLDGAQIYESGLDGPYTIHSITVRHSAIPEQSYEIARSIVTETYRHTQFREPVTTGFVEDAVAMEEGQRVVVRVIGGDDYDKSSVKMYLTYNTAAAADLDLAKGTVDGVVPKGGLKFPLTLSWEAGESEEKVIIIPVKTDKMVEDDEFFTLQLADAEGMVVGEERVCTVTIRDLNDKVLKASVTPYKPKAGETVATNSVTVASGDAKGGFVAGTGDYTSGSKLTLTAEARPGWTFKGWRLKDDETILSAKAKWQVVVTNGAEYVAVFEKIPYVRGLADPADGGKVTGSGLCAAGKKVTLKATVNKNFAFVGWRRVGDNAPYQDGDYIAKTPSLVIDRTAKPAKDTATSTTLTDVDSDATFYACFITAGEDRAAIAASVDGWALEPWVSKSETHAFATNVWAGVYLEWPVAAEALSATTVKVAGLPSGLKFAAKPVTSKVGSGKTAVVVTNVPANTIYGAPTAALKTDKYGNVKPSAVKVTVTTAGKSSQIYQIDTVVEALPSWAQGSFAGGLRRDPASVEAMEGMEDDEFCCGTASLTVSAAGKVSGKAQGEGLTYALAAPYYSGFKAVSEDDGLVSNFLADVTASWSYKEGSKTVKTNDVVRMIVQDNGIGGYASVADWFEAYTVNWKIEPWKTLGTSFNKQTWTYAILSDGSFSENEEDLTSALGADVVGRVTLKFSANGSVSVASEFVSGYNEKKAKYTTVKASGSATLVPVDDTHGVVFVYLTPKGLAPHARSLDVPWPAP